MNVKKLNLCLKIIELRDFGNTYAEIQKLVRCDKRIINYAIKNRNNLLENKEIEGMIKSDNIPEHLESIGNMSNKLLEYLESTEDESIFNDFNVCILIINALYYDINLIYNFPSEVCYDKACKLFILPFEGYYILNNVDKKILTKYRNLLEKLNR